MYNISGRISSPSGIPGMVFLKICCAVLSFCLLFLCCPDRAYSGQPEKIAATGLRIELEINPGRNFSNTGWFLIFPFKKGAQAAAWVEDADGNFLGTIFVTEKTGSGKWVSAPDSGRPESLPVWSFASASSAGADAVTAATSSVMEKKTIPPLFPEKKETYTVYLEVNQSYDWNSVWAKKLPKESRFSNGVNGQPSLVYAASFNTPEGEGRYTLYPAGTGHPLGKDGNIRNDFEGIDSAFFIIESAHVRVSRQ